MIFILYSPIDQPAAAGRVGSLDCSNYSIMKAYRAALQALGTVEIVSEVDQAEEICQTAVGREERCVFLAFCATKPARLSLPCPTICVFAWGFDYLPVPSPVGGQSGEDWRSAFAEYDAILCLSKYTVQAARRAMGEDHPLVVIPAPALSVHANDVSNTERNPRITDASIELQGNIIDSALYEISSDAILLAEPERCLAIAPWDEKPVSMNFRLGGAESGLLVGFYGPEIWGSWSKVAEPWVLMPFRVNGKFRISITLSGYGANSGRRICVKMGNQTIVFVLCPGFKAYTFDFDLSKPADSIQFLGLDLTPVLGAIDERTMGLGLESLTLERIEDSLPVQATECANQSMDFRLEAPCNYYLVGFYPEEESGTWSMINSPSIRLLREVSGSLTLKLSAQGYGPNAGRLIEVEMGGESHSIKLAATAQDYCLRFEVADPIDVIRFSGLDTSPVKDAQDDRSMGIRLLDLEISGVTKLEHQDDALAASRPRVLSAQVRGIVYTAILDPDDETKNWLDMLTGFAFAFREVEDATLLIKISKPGMGPFLGILHYYLQRLAPFKCRILAAQGYLDETAYAQIIDATSYYLNTSLAEGSCQPLVDFMACGVPAIAPAHTALNEHVSEASSFIVASSLEPGAWPGGGGDGLRALRHRLDWWSLVQCLRESYRVATEDLKVYKAKSLCGREHTAEFNSEGQFKRGINELLQMTSIGQERA